jgi:hypothetical protein
MQWSIRGRYLSGSQGEDWVEIVTTYNGSEPAVFKLRSSDPRYETSKANHGNIKSVFKRVASDAGLFENQGDEVTVLTTMIKAFFGEKLASFTTHVCTRSVIWLSRKSWSGMMIVISG